jgi:hypothetical protein
MAGSIEVKKGGKLTPQRSPEFSDTLKKWLATFGETYDRSWSDLALKAYELALNDLTPRELNLACEKALRTWTLAAMPPPGFIREALAIALAELPVRTDTPEEIARAERQFELAREAGESYRAKIAALVAEPLPAKPVKPDLVVVARPERVQELDRQREEILAKHGPKPPARAKGA